MGRSAIEKNKKYRLRQRQLAEILPHYQEATQVAPTVRARFLAARAENPGLSPREFFSKLPKPEPLRLPNIAPAELVAAVEKAVVQKSTHWGRYAAGLAGVAAAGAGVVHKLRSPRPFWGAGRIAGAGAIGAGVLGAALMALRHNRKERAPERKAA